MCCVISSILFIGPRAGLILWYLFDSLRFRTVFDNLLLPILGTIFLPFTTIAYLVLYKPALGGVLGLDWVWIAIAVFVDLSSYGGGIFSRRKKG